MMIQPAETLILAVDVALFSVRGDELQVLLARRPRPPFQGCWGLPGVLVRPDEPLDAAARRALADRAGIRGVFLEQLYTFGRPGRDARGRTVSVAHFALVRPEELGHEEPRGDRETRWVVARAIDVPLAFDHGQIIDYAVWRL